MKNLLILLTLAWPGSLFAQEKGIAFEDHLTWQQVCQKAKAENKYIFVDCYASWCGPCKWMDQHVYSNDSVGSVINKAFIAVKVQMDTSQQDSTEVKNWYATAHDLGEKYQIGVYPSFLFFAADGRAVHKAIGSADARDFLVLARAALDSRKQYYILLAEYRKGTLPYGLTPFLASTAKSLGEDSLSAIIAFDYLRYLGALPSKDLWTEDHIKFISGYGEVIHYGDTIFQRYRQGRIKIDSVIGVVGYADRLINLVAYNEQVRPKIDAGLKAGSEPGWHWMGKTIARKYGNAFARGNILRGRAEYYQAIKKWDKYAKYFVLELQNNHIEDWAPGAGTSWGLNNDAFEIFKYSNSRKELKEALSWINKALSMKLYQAQELDTKANLLYKLGRRSEAMTYEERSHSLASGDKDIQENYEKMKNGQRTW